MLGSSEGGFTRGGRYRALLPMYWKSKQSDRKPSPSLPLPPPKRYVKTTTGRLSAEHDSTAYGKCRKLTAVALGQAKHVDRRQDGDDVFGEHLPHKDEGKCPIEDLELRSGLPLLLVQGLQKRHDRQVCGINKLKIAV